MTEKKGKIVIALGGNALQDANSSGTAEEQLEVAKRTSEYIVEILKNYEAVIVHGNLTSGWKNIDCFRNSEDITPCHALRCCGGYEPGVHCLSHSTVTAYGFKRQGDDIPVATVITQVVVDQNDPASRIPQNPSGHSTVKKMLRI